MWVIRNLLIVKLLLSVHAAFAGGEPQTVGQISKKEAQVLAEKAFLDATKNSIPKYKIISRDDPADPATWKFLFWGIEEYERPGFHVLVIVNKRTRHVEVMRGE